MDVDAMKRRYAQFVNDQLGTNLTPEEGEQFMMNMSDFMDKEWAEQVAADNDKISPISDLIDGVVTIEIIRDCHNCPNKQECQAGKAHCN